MMTRRTPLLTVLLVSLTIQLVSAKPPPWIGCLAKAYLLPQAEVDAGR
jgi:hypothetical protein